MREDLERAVKTLGEFADTVAEELADVEASVQRLIGEGRDAEDVARMVSVRDAVADDLRRAEDRRDDVAARLAAIGGDA